MEANSTSGKMFYENFEDFSLSEQCDLRRDSFQNLTSGWMYIVLAVLCFALASLELPDRDLLLVVPE